jgi:glycosyltransferase A (GT-A) superfamily protein (DUF2064 family)
MRGHVIVFAKEPRLGAVKTRLARDIGAAAALRFYEATLRATLAKLVRAHRRKKNPLPHPRIVAPAKAGAHAAARGAYAAKHRRWRDGSPLSRGRQIERVRDGTHAPFRQGALHGPWQIWLAVTPDGFAHNARRRWRWLPKGVRVVGQGGGDLGARMARAFARVPPGPAVLVGSDIPDIRARHVAGAFAALGRHAAVFGPAEDGGYWLVGQRRLAAMPDLFRDVRWSGPHALADTLANLDAGHTHRLVARLSDVDDGAAYRRLPARRAPGRRGAEVHRRRGGVEK